MGADDALTQRYFMSSRDIYTVIDRSIPAAQLGSGQVPGGYRCAADEGSLHTVLDAARAALAPSPREINEMVDSSVRTQPLR